VRDAAGLNGPKESRKSRGFSASPGQVHCAAWCSNQMVEQRTLEPLVAIRGNGLKGLGAVMSKRCPTWRDMARKENGEKAEKAEKAT
jgi:hypothetical protein